MARTSIRYPDSLDEALEEAIGYGDKADVFRKGALRILEDEYGVELELDGTEARDPDSEPDSGDDAEPEEVEA